MMHSLSSVHLYILYEDNQYDDDDVVANQLLNAWPAEQMGIFV